MTDRVLLDKREPRIHRAGASLPVTVPDPDIDRDRAWAIPNATRPLEIEEAYAVLVEASCLFELVDLRPPEPLRDQSVRRILRRVRASIERLLLRARMSLPPSEGEARHPGDDPAAAVDALHGPLRRGRRTRHPDRPSSTARVLSALRAAAGPLTGPALAAASATKIVTMRNSVSTLRRRLGIDIVVMPGGPRNLSTYRLASHVIDDEPDHDDPSGTAILPGRDGAPAGAQKLFPKT